MIKGRIIKMPPSVDRCKKNIKFGEVVGLTRTAQKAKDAVVADLKSTFTLRGSWWMQSNRFGIKAIPATKAKPQSAVVTRADWLELHETGGDKKGRGGHRIAVPSKEVRRNKRQIIQKGQRPRNLKNSFVFQGKYGPVLARRLKGGPRKGEVDILYGLEDSEPIKKESTFYEPIKDTVQKHLKEEISKGIDYAFRTSK